MTKETKADRARRLAKKKLIETVPCPRCDAESGRPCREPSGDTGRVVPHQARRSAAVDAGLYQP